MPADHKRRLGFRVSAAQYAPIVAARARQVGGSMEQYLRSAALSSRRGDLLRTLDAKVGECSGSWPNSPRAEGCRAVAVRNAWSTTSSISSRKYGPCWRSTNETIRQIRDSEPTDDYPSRGNPVVVPGTIPFRSKADCKRILARLCGPSRPLHVTLSLPPGKSLSIAEWREVVLLMLTLMRFDPKTVPWTAFQHTDTEHEHVHIIVAGRSFLGSTIDLRMTPDRSDEIHHQLAHKIGIEARCRWSRARLVR